MRISFFLRSLLMALSAAACLSAQTQASEMLYYFNFDDGKNTNIVTGTVAGTLNASATFESSGGKWGGGCFKNDGGYAGLKVSGISGVTFTEGFSLSLHIKDNKSEDWSDYLEVGNSAKKFRLERTAQTNTPVTMYGTGATDPFDKVTPNSANMGSDWAHVVISFHDNVFSMTINGVTVKGNAFDASALGNVDFFLLGRPDGRSKATKAYYDDVAFFKGALTNAQMELLRYYAANDPIQTGGLASKDGVYTYWKDTMSLGASVEGMTLGQTLTFDTGVSQNYRFTTADAPSDLGGAVAHSFSVSSLLSDGAAKRGLALTGQDGAENRVVTITNNANTFTGDVSIQKSTLRAQPGAPVTGTAAVALLGTGNKIILQEKGTLDLSTGDDTYLYANGFSFAQAGGKIVQSKGTHTLSGDISLAADGTIENASATALNLTGKILETAASTLSLKTQADANSTMALTGGSIKLSGLNLTGNITSQGGTLETTTLTLNGSSKLSLAQTELVLGTGGVKADTAGGGIIQLDRESSLKASAGFSAAAGVTWDLAENSSFRLNTDTYNVTIAGQVAGQGTTLVKEGTGTLTLSHTVTGITTANVTTGGLAFGSANALSGIKTLNLSDYTSLNLGNHAGKTGQTVQVARDIKLQGASAYTGTFLMQSQASRLNVTGDFKAERISFELGLANTSTGGDNPLVKLDKLDGKATITGTAEGSIILNFDEEYLRRPTTEGNVFQLFSTGLVYVKGSIRNNQKQLIAVDDTKLKTDGSITLRAATLSADMVTQDDLSHWDKYTPSSNSSYLGADGDTVIVGSDITYNIGELPAYRMTPGTGTLVFQGELSGEKSLYIIDYASIDKEAAHSAGSVVITHNGNSYTEGTNVNGTTLVVDLSQGDDADLAAQAQNGNLNVTALGSGEVVGVVGTHGKAVIVLQSYGDQTLADVNTFTYANDFDLSGGATLKQEGANAQILTGDLTFGAGANTLVNDGSKALTVKGNITQTTSDELTLTSNSVEGKIVLDGSGTLEASKLAITGAGRTEAVNGYNVKVWGLTVNDGTLAIQKNSTLTLGKNGLAGTGTFVLDGGTLSSTSSWNADMVVTLGTGTNTVNTGGANVRLNKGLAGEGGFAKLGSGFLYVQDNGNNARGLIDVKQGRLILLGSTPTQARDITPAAAEYKLNGDLTLSSGKGASLSGMIDANGKNVTFGDKTNFYLSAGEEEGLTGYIRNAGTLSFGTGTQLHVDILGEDWLTDKTYTVFSATTPIQGADNLTLALEEDFAFVNISLDKSNANEIGLTLTQKTGAAEGSLYAPTNAGAISSVVTPLVNEVLAGNSDLTGKLFKTMQTVSKMTASEYNTYLSDMGSSASSFYTALSGQVQDATQHINSVRNRVGLLSPVMYDDWNKGGIYNVWAGGVNHYRDVKSDFQSPGYEMTSWGGELGCAIPMSENLMLGVGFAYTFADVQVKDGWGNNESDTYNVDFFARYRKDALTITGVLTGGFTNTEFHRNQIVKNDFTTSNSSTDGNQLMGTLEAGYDFYLNEEKSWILQPLVNLTAGRAKLDGLSETGELKNAGLMIGSQSYNMFSAGIGAKIAYQYKNSVSDQPGRVELKAMYVNDMGDVDFKVNGSFIGAPDRSFHLDGVSNERSAAIVSAGWIAPISAYGQFFVDAGCEFRKDQNGVNTTVGFSFQF